MTGTYDPKCWELAELFLEDEPGLRYKRGDLRPALALFIQESIEDWIADKKGEDDKGEKEELDF